MSNNSYKVLLIDDSKADYYLAEHYMSAYDPCNFKVDWVDNYEDGLKHVLSGNYDFCLVDYRLGGRSGLDLAQKADGAGNDSPIFIYSAEEKSKISGLQDSQNVSGFISKLGLSTESIISELKLVIQGLSPKSDEAAFDGLSGLKDPLVAFDENGQILLVNDAFKQFNFMCGLNIIGKTASVLFNAPHLANLDHKKCIENEIFSTRVYIERNIHHRVLWRMIPVSFAEAPDVCFVAKGVLQKKSRKKKKKKKSSKLKAILSKLYKNPSYININDNYYHRDLFS